VQHFSPADKYGVSLKVFSRLVKTMEDECIEVKESICATVKEMRQAKEREKAEMAAAAAMSTPSRSQPQSRSASPTKSALRDTSKTPAVPSRSAKRKVAFSLSNAPASEDDDDGGVSAPETPSKRPRTTPRRPSTASAERTLPVRKGSSSESVSATSSEEDAEDVEMLELDASLLPQPSSTPTPSRLVASEPVAGPSTPRRRSARAPATPTHAYRTPPSARTQMLSALSADEDEVDDVAEEEEEGSEARPGTVTDDDAEVNDSDDALPPSRRFRPVFLDRAQWVQRAPRLARDRAVAERRMKELIARWGDPFEHLRLDTAPPTAHV
jgi:hypothetical protein